MKRYAVSRSGELDDTIDDPTWSRFSAHLQKQRTLVRHTQCTALQPFHGNLIAGERIGGAKVVRHPRKTLRLPLLEPSLNVLEDIGEQVLAPELTTPE